MRTRKEPMLYVDKTAYLHRLITDSQALSIGSKTRELKDHCVEQFA